MLVERRGLIEKSIRDVELGLQEKSLVYRNPYSLLAIKIFMSVARII